MDPEGIVNGSNSRLRIPTAITTAQATVFTVSMKPPSEDWGDRLDMIVRYDRKVAGGGLVTAGPPDVKRGRCRAKWRR